MNRYIELGKQNIHVVANSMTELTTDAPHVIEPDKKAILDVVGQVARGFQGLRERSH